MIAFLLDNLFFLGYLCAGGLGALILLFGFLAPFESLLWWKNLKIEPHKFVNKLKKFEKQQKKNDAQLFIVYLSGIGVISGDGLELDESHFLLQLAHYLPAAALVSDVFPYSPTGQSLSSDRFFSRLWKYLAKNRLTNRKNILDLLVMLRNGMQVAVASDSRYAPIYNLGTASLILEGLLKKGYDLKNPKPICFVGYSGGAQIAIGAATYLHEIINAPLSLITIAGALTDDPGLSALTHLDYLYSPVDPVEQITPWFFWGRMPFNIFSPWNQAVRSEKITYTNVGNCSHAYLHSYFDYVHHMPYTHATYAHHTLAAILPLLKEKIPPQNFSETKALIRKENNTTDPKRDPKKDTILLEHGEKTDHVLVIFHGYTNSPPQFRQLGELFHQKGYTVFIPTVPFHGYKEKYYKEVDRISYSGLEAFTNESIELASHLGKYIHVMGLSLGGALALYAAQQNTQVKTAFSISPFLRLHDLDFGVFQYLRFLPHIFIPWTFSKLIIDSSAYDSFSLKGLGEILTVGNHILEASKTTKPEATHVTILTNASDVAIAQSAVNTLAKNWKNHGFTDTTIYEIPKAKVPIHDIIDPTQKQQNTAYVYPLIMDLFFKNKSN